jgi:hypothetical protein
MQTVAPSEAEVRVLRAISRAAFAYAPTKSLCKSAGWQLVDDEPDLGYVRYDMPTGTASGEPRPVSVMIAESSKPPFAIVPLFYLEEFDEGRESFDQAFDSLADQLARFLGAAAEVGEYRYPHRPDWSYSFTGWELPDATLVLVQDEFDIQFGMDVTLWVRPARSTVELPMRYE